MTPTHFTNGRRPTGLVAAWALALALLSAPVLAQAQGVTGVVLDSETSAPLPGVLVSVFDAEGVRTGAVLSDAAGRFSMDVAAGTGFTARAERIGLRTAMVDAFEVSMAELRFLTIPMSGRAIEIEGLVVDTRVQQCSANPTEALQVQRWWDEIRKALEVSSLVQQDQLARFRIQRYQREWSADLRSLAGEQTELQIGFATRPFVSASAEFLAEGGFVQGPEGSRDFYAPDADVLLSNVFLAQHCFSVVADDDREDWIGIRFEPSRSRRIPDVMGTLWVDTISAELQTLEYRYANLDWLPPNDSGGEVRFRYLPSGTWIVSDWYIRMPQVGVRYGEGPVGRMEVAGYFDVGGRVRQLATAAGSRDSASGSARIVGTVYDSIAGRPLVGARVAVMGTRFSADTDARGDFALLDLPAGDHEVTFFHSDLTKWGVPSPFIAVEVEDGGSENVELAVPRFAGVATEMCFGSEDVLAVLTGHVVDDEGLGVEGATVLVEWETPQGYGAARTFDAEVRTGSGGRYLACQIPAEARVELTVITEAGRGRTAEVVLPSGEITYRELRSRR